MINAIDQDFKINNEILKNTSFQKKIGKENNGILIKSYKY